MSRDLQTKLQGRQNKALHHCDGARVEDVTQCAPAPLAPDTTLVTNIDTKSFIDHSILMLRHCDFLVACQIIIIIIF
jgi:hypothetical protein